MLFLSKLLHVVFVEVVCCCLLLSLSVVICFVCVVSVAFAISVVVSIAGMLLLSQNQVRKVDECWDSLQL